jgi:hypothetical protein
MELFFLSSMSYKKVLVYLFSRSCKMVHVFLSSTNCMTGLFLIQSLMKLKKTRE